MRETAIVDAIRKLGRIGVGQPMLVQGIGDDCAILRPRASEDLVFTSDLLLEGRHFLLETHSAADVGHKALARSLSDLAAMGSRPVFCLVSLAVPPKRSAVWLKGFYRGLLALAKQHKVVLAGGDLSRFDKVLVDVTCCGRVPQGRALTRSGSKPGDLLYVTGELGGSAAGFASRQGSNWKRHLRPEPRITQGLALRRLGASAAMDLSDGLSLDLARLCRESGVTAQVDTAKVPIAPGATLQDALHGGEDYELLFTVPSDIRVPSRLGKKIGQVCRSSGFPVMLDGRRLEPAGFDHFR